VPIRLLASLATTFDVRGLCDRRKALHYVEEAHRYRIPTRLIAGSRDRQVSVAAVESTARRLGGDTDLVVAGRAHGAAEEYGHWDLVLGTRAQREVWPEVLGWLRLHEMPL
jgi:hypothetical protein